MSVGRQTYDSYDQLYTNPLLGNPYGELYDPIYSSPYDPIDSYYDPFRITPSSLATNSLQDYQPRLRQSLRDHQPRLGQNLGNHQPGLRPSLRDPQNRVRQNLLQRDLNLLQHNFLRDLNLLQHNLQRDLSLMQQTIQRGQRLVQLASQQLQPDHILPRSRPNSFLNSNGGISNSRMVDPSIFQTLIVFKDFKENEVDIRLEDGSVVVSAKQEERTKENGLITKSFFRRCKLPEDVDLDKVTSSFSPDSGVLIRVPRKMKVPSEIVGGRVVPIDVEQSQIVENGFSVLNERPILEIDPENVKK